jgi:hypothetical protein
MPLVPEWCVSMENCEPVATTVHHVVYREIVYCVFPFVCELISNYVSCIYLNLLYSQVKEGDVVTMCSATFGDQMWSTRGVGLTRVLAAIRVRAGPNVSLVFESTKQAKKKREVTSQQLNARQQAAEAAQKKKDALLSELDQDEKRLKKGKFLGLF